MKRQKRIKRAFSFVSVLLVCFSAYGDTSLESLLFTVRCDGHEAGSAFLMEEGGSVWMVSNCHVVQGEASVEFVGMTDDSRRFKLPEIIEVAANRDAVRFRVPDETKGLMSGGDCSFDEAVFAFGNSAGAGVVTKSEGKVVGKGRGEIEVTCEIIPGNSGGPVINADNRIVGIATFIITAPDESYAAQSAQLLKEMQTRKGTRYEHTRRFAVPLHDAEWQPVELAVFREESRRVAPFFEQYKIFHRGVASVFFCRPIGEEANDVFSRGWIRNYHRRLTDCGYWFQDGGRYVIRSARQDSFYRSLRRWAEDLSETAGAMANDFNVEAEAFSILYFRNELNDRVENLRRSQRELLDDIKKIE